MAPVQTVGGCLNDGAERSCRVGDSGVHGGVQVSSANYGFQTNSGLPDVEGQNSNNDLNLDRVSQAMVNLLSTMSSPTCGEL